MGRRKKTLAFAAITDTRKRDYLTALSRSGAVVTSSELAGVSREAIWKWRKSDIEFAEAEACAKQKFTELLEIEAKRRAVDGIDKGVYWKGAKIADEKVYSDQMLLTLLRGNCPEKYGDSLRIGGGEPIKIMSLGINLDSAEVHDAIDKLLLSAATNKVIERTNSSDDDGKQPGGNGSGSVG